MQIFLEGANLLDFKNIGTTSVSNIPQKRGCFSLVDKHACPLIDLRQSQQSTDAAGNPQVQQTNQGHTVGTREAGFVDVLQERYMPEMQKWFAAASFDSHDHATNLKAVDVGKGNRAFLFARYNPAL